MRTASPRRYLDTITRHRRLPGARDDCGEFIEGAILQTELWASVQPLALEDSDFVGGEQTVERVKVYIPSRPMGTTFEEGILTWNGQELTWADAPLSWGDALEDASTGAALQAAFGDSVADRVIVDGVEFVVEESRYWPHSHTRATLLRES